MPGTICVTKTDVLAPERVSELVSALEAASKRPVLAISAVSEEIRFLCEETGGEVLPLYRPEGVGPVIRALSTRASGF
ncbi:hypothetical protein FACS189468_5410 [Spirochaetia bacterium]|nr:hypothetical protein FACS189468_5410 [Spirochaetia bacterium]